MIETEPMLKNQDKNRSIHDLDIGVTRQGPENSCY